MTTTTATAEKTSKKTVPSTSAPVKQYLKALRNFRPSTGRPVTPEMIQTRIAATETSAAKARTNRNVMEELRLTQKALNLKSDLRTLNNSIKDDPSLYEAAFVKAAPGYAAANGITRAAWRKVGVPTLVLTKAGI